MILATPRDDKDNEKYTDKDKYKDTNKDRTFKKKVVLNIKFSYYVFAINILTNRDMALHLTKTKTKY